MKSFEQIRQTPELETWVDGSPEDLEEGFIVSGGTPDDPKVRIPLHGTTSLSRLKKDIASDLAHLTRLITRAVDFDQAISMVGNNNPSESVFQMRLRVLQGVEDELNGLDLEEDLDEALYSVKTTHVVIDTANDDVVVGTASDEDGAKRTISSSERPPISIKNKNTLKIVKLKKPAGEKRSGEMVGYPLKENAELEEEDLDEALTRSQRIKRSNIAKRNSAKMQRAIKKAKSKKASPEKLLNRATKKARDVIFKKLLKGKDKGEASFSEKERIEKKLAKMSGKITKMAKKLIPKLKKAEQQRMASGDKD